MYFETGQGSALSADAHHGVDQQTCEARAYAVARAFEPLLSNTVVGFIGPDYLYDGKQIRPARLEHHLCAKLPQRQPAATLSYGKLIGSLWTLFATTPVLRRRAAYHAGLFGAFSLFWTVVPLVLASPAFGLSGTQIAVFALVGMAGAVASPIAGKLADAGHSLPATAVALALGVAGFALPLLVPGSRTAALAVLVVASIVLDMGVAGNLVLGQRAIFMLGHEVRSRLNGLYFAVFFAGGAACGFQSRLSATPQ